jgi:hypothetical protein
MAGRLSCPDCGATNLDDAEWCGQCYRMLGRSAEATAAVAEAAPAAADATLEATWTCRTCGEGNGLDVDACPVCGMSLFESMSDQSQRIEPQAALRASVVPGLGLGRVGMAGEGLITALLVVFALLGGLIIMAAGEPLAVVLIGGGLVLWLISARDAYVVASSGKESAWLQGRTLTVIAMLLLLLTAASLLRAIPTRGTR